mmetsp:Transcript_93769/g.261056  ORF Transcript_93769/g.261056 Transcript_93769/m.261056 type:complete len:95 (+) Transcript_93769:237-521(+)
MVAHRVDIVYVMPLLQEIVTTPEDSAMVPVVPSLIVTLFPLTVYVQRLLLPLQPTCVRGTVSPVEALHVPDMSRHSPGLTTNSMKFSMRLLPGN